MSHWKELQEKTVQMQDKILARLSEDEVSVLKTLLELEWEHRDLKRPRIRQPLREAIDRIIR